MPHNEDAIYIVDVYVPNEGEPGSALELTILCLEQIEKLPRVFVHTFLQLPACDLNLVHWHNAAGFGLKREMFEHSSWPSLDDIIDADYLKNKTVVCFCDSMEPVQTLVQNSRYSYSLLNMWQTLFRGNEAAAGVTTCEEMLEFIGLDPEDRSNSRYTPLMKRARAYLVIWMYLYSFDQYFAEYKQLPPLGDLSFCLFDLAKFWPISGIPEPWYPKEAKAFLDIPQNAIESYFSERLPDYVDWSQICIYDHEWTFGRSRNFEGSLDAQDAMLNFIFYRLFKLSSQILILTFYALYNDRTEYARIVALNHDNFSDLPKYVRDDFGAFIISHLDDFLSGSQKRDIITALVRQAMSARADLPFQEYDYDALYKASQNKLRNNRNNRIRVGLSEDAMTFHSETLDSNHNIAWFREISSPEKVLYRHFLIRGTNDERNECIDKINDRIKQLLTEAQNPMTSVWITEELTRWIENITGFQWNELARSVRYNDSQTLIKCRYTLSEIITDSSHKYLKDYLDKLRKVIDRINELPEGQCDVYAFSFQGISHVFEIDKSAASLGLLSKLRHLF